MEIPPEDLEKCIEVLQRVANARGTIVRSQRFDTLVSKVYREGKRYETQARKRREWEEDRLAQAETGMVQIQRDATPLAALTSSNRRSDRVLNSPEACYICKKSFTQLHFFYHLLCPECAELNYAMRDLHADLRGRVALVTGGRVKIGFQTVLRLLRDGARVLVTTRFPNAAARRFYEEADSSEWRSRLELYGLDLRNIPAVESFSRHLLGEARPIDIVIHNAAQTIRRPPGFYQDLVAQEHNPERTLSLEARQLVKLGAPSTLSISDSSALLPAELGSSTDILPVDDLADNEERADSRTWNSWLLRLEDVGAQEMLEVQLVNAVAPFLLNSRLKPLMVSSPFERRFIVNVSAMEGQFSRHKTVYHPHTNMAKASLNMMTRTSGEDYAKDGIYMNSVDTGWVTDENPTIKRERIQQDQGFFAPLDIVDGMVRIYHPVAIGINSEEEPPYGLFLKDFKSCPW